MASLAGAAQLQEARVTQVVNDVKLQLEQAAPRPAAVSDLVRHVPLFALARSRAAS